MAIFVTYFFVTGEFDPRQSWMKLKVWKLKTYKRKYMDTQRITSNWIQELKPNEIFVFGSNLEGQHGGGAALLAYRKWGAIWGQGAGLQGQTYGIPTMHGRVEAIRPLCR